jgi:hypothetical protein
MDRKHKAINWTALIVALGTAAGGGIKAFMDSYSSDSMQTVVAREIATSEAWRRSMAEDIEDNAASLSALLETTARLREAVASLRASVEFLSRGRRVDARKEADEIDEILPSPQPMNFGGPKTKARRASPVGEAQVQALKGALFE